MSKDEPSRGLLSKVVRFVRNPTGRGSEDEAAEDDRDSLQTRQMLKDMIERKRRNDFVRRREFDQLRQLRQRGALQAQRIDDSAVRPSFLEIESGFGASSPDDRAGTIRKIDEIEEQMSQQWWRSRQAPIAAAAPAPSASPSEEEARQARAFAPTTPLQLPSQDLDLRAHGQDELAQWRNWAVRPAVRPGADGPAPAPAQPPSAATSGAPAAFRHDPDLEEAAIRFASGDAAGAEAALRELLAQQAQAEHAAPQEVWLALFDLYRATGQQEPFEALAIEFAGRFGRSAPLWFSLPELAGMPPEPPGSAPAMPAREFKWTAPADLAPQSVAALKASTQRAAAPWDLTWTRLQRIDAAAVPALADLFTQWAEQRDAHLAFHGVEALLDVLQAGTPSGDSSAPPQGWRLRLAALRLLGRLDEFELVALDYCVTYEVSPPSWAPPLCVCSGGGGGTDWAALEDMAGDPHTGFGAESSFLPSQADSQARLAGVVEGDAAPLLEPLALAAGTGPLVVACDRLIRMDFAAAGSVLNWSAEQQAQGGLVHFVQLPRLVAVFFNVVGIGEHARIVPRTN